MTQQAYDEVQAALAAKRSAEAKAAFRSRVSTAVREYIDEAEHQDGDDYWSTFSDAEEIFDDFLEYWAIRRNIYVERNGGPAIRTVQSGSCG